jgi:hypothetical protein
MKKSMLMSAVLAGGLIIGNAHADLMGTIAGATSTYNQAKDFKKNTDQKFADIKALLAKAKTQKGGEKAKEYTQVLTTGLGLMDDVSSILVSVITTLSEALDTIPSDKTKNIGSQLSMLLYANAADKDANLLTGPVGSVANVVKVMKQISGEFAKAADKAAQSQAAGATSAKPAAPTVAKDDLLEL